MKKILTIFLAALAACCQLSYGQSQAITNGSLGLPAVIGSGMVLQQGQRVPIWGWAEPGQGVTVKFAGQVLKTTADGTGKWMVYLKPLKASDKPAEMEISSGDAITLTNILVGEVWLASGQSNMEKPLVKQQGQKPCFNAEQDIAQAEYPHIRLFKVEKGKMSPTPLPDVPKFFNWRECSSNSLSETSFSAAAYYFAREIHTNLHVPVGIIESSWGGTRIEPWTPPDGFFSVAKLAEFAQPQTGENEITKTQPMRIYNSMIHPLVPYGIRGALWYQGESNCMGETNRLVYAEKMEALIKGWRQVWNQGDFPFYYVQLAPYAYSSRKGNPVTPPDALPLTWEAQFKALRVPNTGIAPSTDLTDDLKDIHPRNKLDVGRRLAFLALNKTYDFKNVVCSGPVYKSMKVRLGKVYVSFAGVDGGLVTKDGKVPGNFEVLAADGNYLPAHAVIEGETVVVWNPTVAYPTVVRFAWDEAAQPNLFNKAGLPAYPFRTDAPKE